MASLSGSKVESSQQVVTTLVSHSGHQAADNWSQGGHLEVTKQPQIDRKVATKWSWTHQLVTKRPLSYPKEVNERSSTDPKLIPKCSKCGQQTAINVSKRGLYFPQKTSFF